MCVFCSMIQFICLWISQSWYFRGKHSTTSVIKPIKCDEYYNILVLTLIYACESFVFFQYKIYIFLPSQNSWSRVHCLLYIWKYYSLLYVQAFCVVFCLYTLLVGRGRMRSHPSPANSHQSGLMLEPQREETIAHSTGAHSPSTQGGQGHLTHQGPVYFSLLSCATVCVCVSVTVYVHAQSLVSCPSLFCLCWWAPHYTAHAVVK